MNSMKKIAVALVAVMALTACGGNETSQTDAPKQEASVSSQVQNAPAMTENELREHLGVDESGYVTVKGNECEAAVVMTSPEMVNMYAEAGDLVVSNPEGNLGVKVVGDDSGECTVYFMEKLMVL